MRDKKVTFIVQAAVIAALYVVLTFVANALGLASHTIQVRFSEALCILPVFTPAAIPGLWIGCLLANLLTGAVIYDVIFGSIATLLAQHLQARSGSLPAPCADPEFLFSCFPSSRKSLSSLLYIVKYSILYNACQAHFTFLF